MANQFNVAAIRQAYYQLEPKMHAGVVNPDDIRRYKGAIENAVTLDAGNDQPAPVVAIVGPAPVSEAEENVFNMTQNTANEVFQGEGEVLGQEFNHSLKVHQALMAADDESLRQVGSLHELILRIEGEHMAEALASVINDFPTIAETRNYVMGEVPEDEGFVE